VCFERPRRMIYRQFRRWLAPSFLNGRPGCEPFKTVAMKWAATRIVVPLPIVRDSNVPHFGMN